jgi:putative nucleotidyltransferase with HDIG domain
MDYISIRVTTIRGDQKIGFDVYIKIHDKMILFLHKGDSFEGRRLQRLKEKKLKKMFILKQDEPQYLVYLQTNLDSAYDRSSVKDISVRAEIIVGSQQGNIEEVFENPDSPESYNKIKNEAAKYVDFILNQADSVKALMSVDQGDQLLSQHCVNVATLSVGLAQKLNLVEPEKIQLMALGAFLHDFGHILKPIDLKKPVSLMSADEQSIWKQHTQVGAEALRDKKHLDADVLNIILNHEENVSGTGPLGVSAKDQLFITTIVASANTVDRMITFEGIQLSELKKKFAVDYIGRHPLIHIQHLTEIIKQL